MKIDDEWFVRAGIVVDVKPYLDLALTVAFATTANPDAMTRQSYSEVVGGPSVRVGERVAAFAAAGRGVQDGCGAPDWRALAGVRYLGAGN